MDLSMILNSEEGLSCQLSASSKSESSNEGSTPKTPREVTPPFIEAMTPLQLRCTTKQAHEWQLHTISDISYDSKLVMPHSPRNSHELGTSVWEAKSFISAHDRAEMTSPQAPVPCQRTGETWEYIKSASGCHEPSFQVSVGLCRISCDSHTDTKEPSCISAKPCQRLPSLNQVFPLLPYQFERPNGCRHSYSHRSSVSTEVSSMDLRQEDTKPNEIITAPSKSQRCAFTENCQTNVPLRRIVSHYFGRNKKETRAIPDHMWVVYCRQHYQRSKYRQKPWDYARTQMDLVRRTVQNLEQWGEVVDFSINLRKRAVEQLHREDEDARTSRAGLGKSSTRREHPKQRDAAAATQMRPERWLAPYVGQGKSFAEVYAFIDMVAAHADQERCKAAEFELVPNIRQPLGLGPQRVSRYTRVGLD